MHACTTHSYSCVCVKHNNPPSSNRHSDSVTLLNLPYATAVATVGSESNLLRVGARGGTCMAGAPFSLYVHVGRHHHHVRAFVSKHTPVAHPSIPSSPLKQPTALKQIRQALLEEFLPTMKEAAAVFAAQQAIKLMEDSLAKVCVCIHPRLPTPLLSPAVPSSRRPST